MFEVQYAHDNGNGCIEAARWGKLHNRPGIDQDMQSSHMLNACYVESSLPDSSGTIPTSSLVVILAVIVRANPVPTHVLSCRIESVVNTST
jgi:hypothetical protein